MQKTIGSHLIGKDLQEFLEANSESIEEKEYFRYFDQTEVAELKDELAETDIKINDIEVKKKEVNDEFSFQLKPLVLQKKEILSGIKQNGRLVTENLYKLVNWDDGQVGYYNKNGILVETRVLKPGEGQLSIQPLRKQG